jgi:pimeloyl-ACP methyl ester carboxylesterase
VTVVLLLHGLGGDRSQPLSLVTPALRAGETVLAPDLRAHGASTLLGGPADFTFSALCRDLLAELPPLDGPLTVIGISTGAAIGLRLAIEGLLPIERLVLLRPAFDDVSLPPNLEAFPVIGELLSRYPAAEARRRFEASSPYRRAAAESPMGAQGLIDQFDRPAAAERAIRLVEIPRNRAFDDERELGGVRLPAAVIGAPRDPLHPLSIAERWAGALPESTLDVLPARDDDLRAYLRETRSALSRALAR